MLPLGPVAGQVDFQHGLPKASVLGRANVDRDRASVDRDRELLAGQVAGADLGPGADVPEAHGIGSRAEVERAAVEDPVHGTRQRTVISGDRGQREQAHPGQASADLFGAQPPLRIVNPQQMRSCGLIAAVDQGLELGEIVRRLVHRARLPFVGPSCEDVHVRLLGFFAPSHTRLGSYRCTRCMTKHPPPTFAGPSLAPESAPTRERPAHAPRLQRSHDGWFANFMRGLAAGRRKAPSEPGAQRAIRSQVPKRPGPR